MHDDSRKVELPRRRKPEKPIPSVYPVLDTELARDNVENHIPAADREPAKKPAPGLFMFRWRTPGGLEETPPPPPP